MSEKQSYYIQNKITNKSKIKKMNKIPFFANNKENESNSFKDLYTALKRLLSNTIKNGKERDFL